MRSIRYSNPKKTHKFVADSQIQSSPAVSVPAYSTGGNSAISSDNNSSKPMPAECKKTGYPKETDHLPPEIRSLFDSSVKRNRELLHRLAED